MAKSANQKLKLLYLKQILEQQSDEQHPLTVNDLIRELGRFGVSAERKSIYDDIEALQLYGVDVVVVRGRSNAYFIGGRDFQLPELKLLVDAAQSAKFITEKKSAELIRKIGELASRHQAAALQRQVYVKGRVKTMNESIYYNVDELQNAMAAGKRVRCLYHEWVVAPKAPRSFERRPRHDGALYELSPWALIWDDENYYLVAYDSHAHMLKHFRVDKLDAIEETGLPREGAEQFAKLDIAEYTKRRFGMFGGEESEITLRVANRLIGVVVDRFGKDIHIRPGANGTFEVAIKAVASPQFVAWVLGFGGEAEVLAPAKVRNQILQTISEVQRVYR